MARSSRNGIAGDVRRKMTFAGHPSLGDKVTVQVVRVDMARRQVELGLTDILDKVRRQEAGRSTRSRVKSKPERKRTPRPGRRERAARRQGKRR